MSWSTTGGSHFLASNPPTGPYGSKSNIIVYPTQVNIQTRGADMSGGTASDAAWTAAKADIPSGGGDLYIPPGILRTDLGLTMDVVRMGLIGAGMGATTIKKGAGCNLLYVDQVPSRLRDFTVDGVWGSLGGDGVRLNRNNIAGYNNFVLENLLLTNMGANLLTILGANVFSLKAIFAINVGGSTPAMLFDSCTDGFLTHIDAGGALGTGQGIRFTACADMFGDIMHAFVNGGDGIGIDNPTGFHGFTNVRSSGNTGFGIKVSNMNTAGVPVWLRGGSLTSNTAGTISKAGSQLAGLKIHEIAGYNPRGDVGADTPAFPGTGVAVTNSSGGDVTAFIVNGTGAITQIAMGGTNTNMQIAASGFAAIRIPAGQSITFTYASGAPAWKWSGD